jgi:Mg2+-importing ATPase
MVQFGVLSAAFDFMTFALLLGVFHAGASVFRTGWFVESLLTELAIALVVRTRRPFYRSRPGTTLWVTTAALVPLAVAIPYLPLVDVLEFVPLPAAIMTMIAAITIAYVLATEVLKRLFYRGSEK